MSLFGFPLRIQPAFFAMAALLGFTGTLDITALVVWIAVVFVSVLWHELGHAFAMRRYGCSPSITLYAFGGLTHAEGRPLTPGQRLIIAVAGPGFGFLAGAAVFAWLTASGPPRTDLARHVVINLLWVNVGWGALNLLPILPLDGGHAFEAGWEALTRRPGRYPALLVSLVTAGIAVALAAWAGWTWAALIAAFTGFSSWEGLRQLRASKADEGLVPRIEAAAGLLGQPGGLAKAHAEYQALVREAKSDDVRARVFELGAWTALAGGDPLRAAGLVAQMGRYRPSEPLLGALATFGELEGLVHDDTLRVGWEHIEELLTGGDPATALAECERLLVEVRTPFAAHRLRGLFAHALLDLGRPDKADTVLDAVLDAVPPPDPLTLRGLQARLGAAGHTQAAGRISSRLGPQPVDDRVVEPA